MFSSTSPQRSLAIQHPPSTLKVGVANMPSELKSETSRANGAKSHGPKTTEGKEASSRNAIKHGFTARNTYILECENKQDFQEFWAEHIEIHQPAHYNRFR